MTSRVPVCAMPALDPAMARINIDVPVGMTVAQIIEQVLPRATDEMLDRARVWLVSAAGETLLSIRANWARIRPRAGVRVMIRLAPAGDMLRNALMIAVAIGASALGQYWVGPAILGATGSAALAGIGSAVFATAVTLAGGYLVNLLIPPPTAASQQSEKPLYQISGWGNSANPDGAVPSIVGKVRVAPLFAAPSYTEIVGDDQYVRALFTFGYGPVELSDLKIKETPLSKFTDVQYEIRNGYADDAPITLYPQQVLEEVMGVELRRDRLRDSAGNIIGEGPETPVTRFTAGDVTEGSVILSFPIGLVEPESGGKSGGLGGGEGEAGSDGTRTVVIRIRQRPAAGGAWANVTTLTISAKKRSGFYRTFRWAFPSRGRWEIELTRVTHETEDAAVADRTVWLSLQSFRPEKPINFDKPICVVALRIKATYQLNSQIDSFNAIAERLIKDYDHTTGNWLLRKTNNPAAIKRHALQGPECAFPEPDSALDLEWYEDFHNFCRIKGLKYDRIHDAIGSQWDKLTEIAAAGRASPRFDGVKWSGVIDRPQELVVAHVNQRNSRDFRWRRSYVEPPHAFRVSFLDATSDYQQRERVVRWPGYSGPITVTEQLPMPGKTDPAEIWREARRRQYEIIHRPDQFSAIQDGAVRTATRGDLVKGSYDVLTKTMLAARVTAVRGNAITMDAMIEMEAGESYATRFMVQLGEGDDATFESIMRPVLFSAHATDTLVLTGEGQVPARGELVQVGIAGQESLDLIVAGTQAGDDMTSVLTMLSASPIIDTLTDAEVPPAWNGRAGDDAGTEVAVPAVPKVTGVVPNFDTDGDPDGVIVLMEPGAGSSAIVGQFVLHHRLAGTTTWTINPPVPAADGSARATGYAAGANIEMRVQAISIYGYSGPLSGVFTAEGASAPIPPAAPTAFNAVLAGSAVNITWTTPNDAAHYATRIWRGTTNVFSAAVDISGAILGGPNVAQSTSNSPGSGTRFYWATSETASGLRSTPAGPQSVTVP